MDFNSTVNFGEKKEKNATLKNVLEDFPTLDLRPSMLESNDIIGDAYEYMIANFASDVGKDSTYKAGIKQKKQDLIADISLQITNIIEKHSRVDWTNNKIIENDNCT